MERWIFKDDHLFLTTNLLWYPDPSHMRLLRKKEMTVLGLSKGPQESTVLSEVSDIPSTVLLYPNPSSYLLPRSEVGITTHVS